MLKLTQAQIDALPADVRAIVQKQQQALEEANKPRKIFPKVSAKGAVSLYGMGRYPVTLYAEQWQRLLEQREAILAFIAANAGSLKTKADATADNATA